MRHSSFADAAGGHRRFTVATAQRTEPRIWCGRPAWRMEARRGGSCFQRLSPYPVALSCALQLAWASCPKSRFLFFALFFNTKTDCIVSCIWSSVVCTVACYCTSLIFFLFCSTNLLKRMSFLPGFLPYDALPVFCIDADGLRQEINFATCLLPR